MAGEILREKRISLGRELREAADFLKIRYEYLRALEENNFSKLPPPVYTRGYIREYARFLGLDPSPLLDAYGGWQSPTSTKIEQVTPDRKHRSLSKPALFLAPIAVVVVAVIVLMLSSSKQDKTMEIPIQSPKTEKAQTNNIPTEQHTLDVTATETTWLSVETEEGKTEEALMRQSDTRKFVSRNGFDMKIGNAGGIRIRLDGRDLGSPGARGQVIRIKLPEDKSMQPDAAQN